MATGRTNSRTVSLQSASAQRNLGDASLSAQWFCAQSVSELLSPAAERSKVFYLGNKQFDPVKLGLDTSPLKGASEFDVNLPGNSNAGHEFNDGPKGKGVIGRKLTEEERMQIIEYFKTL